MATEKAVIGKEELGRAVQMAESRQTPDGKPFIFTDQRVLGLRLFVQSSKASWIVRWRDVSKTLGYCFPDDHVKSITVAQARDLATSALRMLQAGKPKEVDSLVIAYHEQQRGKKSVAKAVEAIVPPAPTTWTLRECFEATIKDKMERDARNKIGKTTEKDIRTLMKRPCFQDVLDKPAALVTNDHIERVRDAVYEEAQAVGQSGASPSNKVVSYTRAVFEHCASNRRAASGIDPSAPWWKMLQGRFGISKRTRRPDVENLVRTLILAEEYLKKPLPGRSISVPGVNAGTLAGLWWLALTGQRALAGLTLLPYNIGEDPTRPGTGWLLAAWDESDQKGGKSFVLPIPQRAWSFIDGFRQRNKHKASAKWVFPSEKDPEKHTTPSGVFRVIYRLADKDTVEQPPAEETGSEPPKKTRRRPVRTEHRNLLEENDLTYFSPHDIRKTLTSFMEDARIPGAASVVLAHEVDEEEFLRASSTEQSRSSFREQQMKRITRMAYSGGDDGSQFMGLKSKAMKLWTDALLDLYDDLTGRTANVVAARKRKDLSYFLTLDPGFAKFRKAEAEASVDGHIQGYESEITAGRGRIATLRAAGGDHADAIADEQREIESCLISIDSFKRDRAKLILAHAVRNRRVGDQPDVDPAVDVPNYDAAWHAYIVGDVEHDALITAAQAERS